jgi:outer membrane protein OmpA-like peptidoglycan-associated protein
MKPNQPIVHTSTAIAFLLTIGLSLTSYAVDEHCTIGHETCPEHFTPTTYTTTYQEMINNQIRPVGYIAPKAQSVTVPKSEPVISPITPVVTVTSTVPTADSDHDGILDVADKCPNTPKGYKVDTKGCPSSVTLHINFETGSNTIPKSSENDVQTLTTFMQENPASSITIIGHTDNVGKATKNLNLSKARAEALALRIIKNGISDQRITTEGKGLSQPIASNKTKAGRAENRRIDVKIR